MLNHIFHAIKTIPELRWSFPMFALYAMLAALISGYIKIHYRWNTDHTRKIFHFLIFTAAAVIQFIWALPGVLLFGMTVAVVILWACVRKNQSPFYQSIARSRDNPHQLFFIVLPFIATGLGGLISNLLFRDYAIFGYLLVGWGDAAAEPAGIRWGRHKYSVLSMAGIKAIRSLEGSLTLFVIGIIACMLLSLFFQQDTQTMIPVALMCSLTGVLVEAVSIHGMDNLTVQVAVSGMAYLILN